MKVLDVGVGTGLVAAQACMLTGDAALVTGVAPQKSGCRAVNPVKADFAAVVARVTSVSFIAALPPAEFARVVDQVRTLLATHPETKGRSTFELPYRTGVYWCTRARPSSAGARR